MNILNEILNKIFPDIDIAIGAIISEIHGTLYTYVGAIAPGVDLKVSFSENSDQKACILLACAYNNRQELVSLKNKIDYMNVQIKMIDKDFTMKEIQIALHKSGIHISQNCTMDLVIGSGTKTVQIL